MSQIEARNAEELSSLREREEEARRRMEKSHARAMAKAEQSARRSEGAVADLEKAGGGVTLAGGRCAVGGCPGGDCGPRRPALVERCCFRRTGGGDVVC